jgi:hypothetical protein
MKTTPGNDVRSRDHSLAAPRRARTGAREGKAETGGTAKATACQSAAGTTNAGKARTETRKAATTAGGTAKTTEARRQGTTAAGQAEAKTSQRGGEENQGEPATRAKRAKNQPNATINTGLARQREADSAGEVPVELWEPTPFPRATE